MALLHGRVLTLDDRIYDVQILDNGIVGGASRREDSCIENLKSAKSERRLPPIPAATPKAN
ncbi:MAG: hypothetical protein ACYTX0_40645 [Nostoc sp.]